MSLFLWNWRMKREVELLSQPSHPSIPRLLDKGGPLLSSSDEYPFFVMEWVQGSPLYTWAEQHAPSAEQVCRVLAQLARALEAVHAAGAVHRDVKGDNVLVRLSDRLPVLIDFGSCHFAGAERLTWQSLPPVTLAYLSPQAGPETRGTAKQVAEALEAAASETVDGAERPERPRPLEQTRARKRWLALAAAGACAVVLPHGSMSVSTPGASDAQSPDAGTTALGDSSTAKSQNATPPATDKGPLAQTSPPEPRPGQARPDEKGRCPERKQVAINGGCWFEFTSMSAEECTESGNLLLKGKCYVPAVVPPQKSLPTSSPAEAR